MINSPSASQEFSSKVSPVKVIPITEDKKTVGNSGEYDFLKDEILRLNMQKTLAEFVGTFFLVFAGCGAVLVIASQAPTGVPQPLTGVGIAIAWGLVLTAAIYAVGHISGAHFNPAVTLAFAAIRKFSWKLVPIYMLAQLLGATLASVSLKEFYHHQGGIQVIVTQYQYPTSNLRAFGWEFMITFILMFNICAVATDHRASKDFAGIAIGATLTFNAIIAGPITGASMNPARSLGPAIVTGIYENIWVFIVAPTIGAVVGALIYSLLRVPEKTEESNKGMHNELDQPEV